MEKDMNQPPLPALCRSGCGFYGSPASDGFCSKCFKDTLKRKQDPGRLSPTTSSAVGNNKNDGTQTTHESVTTTSSCLAGTPIIMNGLDNVDMPAMIQNALNEKLAAAAAEESSKKCGEEDETSSSSSESSCSSNDNNNNVGEDAGSDVIGKRKVTDVTSSAAAADEQASTPPPKKSNRCDNCRKKVGFTGFECRCGGLFCAVHRYSDMHQCTFDYKALGAEEIRKNNPVVKLEKIQKL